MNKKNLILTSTVGMSREDWLAFRSPVNHVQNAMNAHLNTNSYNSYLTFFNSDFWKDFQFPCIGASEIATVMGLNPYKSVIELFFEKVGIKEVPDFDNPAMFWGRELEEQIASKWQYWEDNQESLIFNFTADRIVRRCRRINAYVQNKAFPWIFVSLDRVINKGGLDKSEGALECKTISGYAADMWENGIPPMYVVQNQTQLLACEFDFGEIAILKDGRNFDVLPFDKNENICASILRQSEDFYKRVKEGIKHFFLASVSTEDVRLQHLHEIDKLAPDPDGSVSYENYLKARFTDRGFSKDGGPVELEEALIYDEIKDKIEALQTTQRECSNKLKNVMGEASELSFGENGKVMWRANKNGVRTFKVALKIKKEVVKIEESGKVEIKSELEKDITVV